MNNSHSEDVYLLLGSNMGDKESYISNAIMCIREHIGIVKKESSLYKTTPWGKTDQPDFINKALIIVTFLEPKQVLDKILYIEKSLGRERTEHWGSRTIDIDILFYGNEIVEQPGLSIPHPQLQNRAFVLLPLLEIAPDFIHPIFEQSICQLRNKLNDDLSVEKFN